jgi:hypothetical protein
LERQGEDEPRGRKKLHINEATGDIFVVFTNELQTTKILVLKVVPPTSTSPAESYFSEINFASLATVTITKKVKVWGVVLSVDPATGIGGLWITGALEGSASIPGYLGGFSDGFITRVSTSSSVYSAGQHDCYPADGQEVPAAAAVAVLCCCHRNLSVVSSSCSHVGATF